MIRSEVVRKLRILDFDTECRPMHYSDWRPESQLTAYAWSWVGEHEVHSRVLHQNLRNEEKILREFLAAVAEADMLVGHYIRRHDLPLINDHCIRFGLPPINNVLVQDTKLDIIKGGGLGMSQENLSLEFELTSEKHSMSGALWRRANTLSRSGQAEALRRVESDVIQNKELYAELKRRDILHPGRLWSA